MNSGIVQGKLVKYLLGPQSEEPDEAAGSSKDEPRLLLFQAVPLLVQSSTR